jgi:curved DNA-binding protein CbpA
MKKAYEYFGLSCGAGASQIKEAYKRRAVRDHSDKGSFDNAFRETHSKYAKFMKHALVTSKTGASSKSLFSFLSSHFSFLALPSSARKSPA